MNSFKLMAYMKIITCCLTEVSLKHTLGRYTAQRVRSWLRRRYICPLMQTANNVMVNLILNCYPEDLR